MLAELVPNEAIPGLAAQTDPNMLGVLSRLEREHFIQNRQDLDQETSTALQRLMALELVDAGYTEPTNGKPYLWTRNGNGSRVLWYALLEIKLKVTPRARTALDSLAKDKQLAVLEAAASFRKDAPPSWPKAEAISLDEHEPVYLLRVPPDLRAFVEVNDSGEIELFDIVREEALRLFR